MGKGGGSGGDDGGAGAMILGIMFMPAILFTVLLQYPAFQISPTGCLAPQNTHMPALMQNYYAPGSYNASNIVPWWYYGGPWTVFTSGARPGERSSYSTDARRMPVDNICPIYHDKHVVCSKRSCRLTDYLTDCIRFEDASLFTSIDAVNAAQYGKTTNIAQGVNRFISGSNALLAACVLAWILIPFAHAMFIVMGANDTCADIIGAFFELSVFFILFALSVYALYACYYDNPQLLSTDAWTALFPTCNIAFTPNTGFLGILCYQIVSLGLYLLFIVGYECKHQCDVYQKSKRDAYADRIARLESTPSIGTNMPSPATGEETELAPSSSLNADQVELASSSDASSKAPLVGTGHWKRKNIIMPVANTLIGIHARVKRMTGSTKDDATPADEIPSTEENQNTSTQELPPGLALVNNNNASSSTSNPSSSV